MGGSGAGGGPPDANPELLTRGAGPMPEWIMRDFTAGMHCNPVRDAIAEQDLWWMENLQPLASGNVVPTGAFGFGGGATAATANFVPYYSTMVNLGSRTVPSAFMFSAFPDGSAWLTNLTTGVGTQIMAPGTLSGSLTYAVAYTGATNLGFLIIDPNGYWDYNLTTVGTLTSLSNAVTGSTNTYKTTVAGGTALKQVFVSGPGGGTAGVFQAHYQVTSVTPNAAGTGYVPGDILSLTDNNPVTAAQITVTATGGGGAISSVSLSVPGDYPGPTTSGLVTTGPTGNVVTGGSGTGATFHVFIEAFKLVIVNSGHGYAIPTSIGNETAAPVAIDYWNLTIGQLTGTSIATYAGRVFVGNANTLTYSDINSYSNFGGAGGQATFSDSYLLQGITVLYTANNYLYVFGSTSVDIVSNVQVNATTGVTSFSRVNAIQGLGCVAWNNMTVIGYGRGVVFLDLTGLYLLAGATPERISERIQACVRGIPLIAGGGSAVRPSCGLDNLNNELCLVFQVTIADTFSHPTTQGNRVLVFIYQRRRWWVASDQFGNTLTSNIGPLSGTAPFGGNFGAWRLQANSGQPTWNASPLFSGNPIWQLRTKLWDGGRAFSEKEAINVAVGGVWNTPGPAQTTNVTVTIDSELFNSNAITVPNIPTVQVGQYKYALQVIETTMAQQQALGSQYIGLTFFGAFPGGNQQMKVLEVIALRGKQERNMLE